MQSSGSRIRTLRFAAVARILSVLVLFSALRVSATAEESWKFVSIPDFMNADIGTLVGYPGFPDGGKDSTTPGFEATLAFYLDAIAAEQPEMVLVAGDLVEGEWHRDSTGRNIFGTYGSHAEREVSLDNAANLYYGQWLERFTSRGLNNVYAAIGDHELGDNDWGTGSNRARLVPNFKDAFARHFTQDDQGQSLFAGKINGVDARPVGTPYENTSYAVKTNNVLLVTLDVFRQDSPSTKLDNRTGSVLATMGGDHLAWLDTLLAAAETDPNIDHVIVQAHTPVLTPVRVRGSSELYLRDYDDTTNRSNADQGAATDLWQTLAARNVDFFFAGEVHHNTLSVSNGVTQLVHDGIPFSEGHYLVGTVTGKKVEFELKHVDIGSGTETFWQTVGNNKRETVVLGTEWETAATATYDKSTGMKKLINPTGELAPFGTNDGSIVVQQRVLNGETLEVGGLGLEVVPAQVAIQNHNFEQPAGTGPPGIVSGTVVGWNEEVGNASTIDGEAGGSAPANFSQTGRLHDINGAAIHQNLDAYWVEGETYTLTFNGWEAGWRVGTEGDAFAVELLQQDGTLLWTSGSIDVDGTLSGSYGNISEVGAPNAYSFDIETNTFTSGTPGSSLRLRVRRAGGVTWFDNFTLTSDTAKHNGLVSVEEFATKAGSTLRMELFDTAVFDRVLAFGDMFIEGGTLEVALVDGAPALQLGDSFDLFDFASVVGSFDLIDLPALSPGLAWDTSSLETEGVISVAVAAPGDFNGDGLVDRADLLKWEADYGLNANSDADGDGDSDGVDFLFWQREFSASLNPTVPAAAVVPEPQSAVLAIVTIGSYWAIKLLARIR